MAPEFIYALIALALLLVADFGGQLNEQS